MLNLANVSFAYGNVQALYDVTLAAPPGKVTAIMGRNGVGKTTLIKTICGLNRHFAGSVELDGDDLSKQPTSKRAKAGVGLVPQGRQIFPKLTVEENLRVSLACRRDGKKSIPPEIFETFPILKEFLPRKGGDLSGGQQQQLAIARALVGDPKVLLLDEPTEGIQPNIIQQIGVLLRKLAAGGMAVVLVEQYLDFVKETTDRYYVMNRGRVVAEGETASMDDGVIAEHLHV